MKLKKDNKVFEVVSNRRFYLFLDDNMIISADSLKSLDLAKYHVLNTLCIVGVAYDKQQGLFEDEEGYMHEVRLIYTKGK